MPQISAAMQEALRREKEERPDPDGIRKDSHTIGMQGEIEFSRVFGLPLDLTPRRTGDGGVDFLLPTTLGDFVVDVKTATHYPPWMLVPVKDCVATTIYVLASYLDGRVKLHGWQWGKRVEKGERGDFAHTGKDNYRLMPNELRPMIDLLLAKI